jgi:hypothetical protein
MHTAKPFVPEPRASEAKAAIGKLKRYKSKVLTKFQQEGQHYILISINLLS